MRFKFDNLFLEPTPKHKRTFGAGGNYTGTPVPPSTTNKAVATEDNKAILDENGNAILTE